MPPFLALVLTVIPIGYLLRRDSREEPRVSKAVWIPIAWLMINGSRQVSQWLGGSSGLGSMGLHEGSPIDRAVYGTLIVAGLCILASRRVQVREIVKENLPLVLFLLYAGLSLFWSDFPFITFRRWVKALGDPIMVLVLMSDPFPVRAIIATIKRCAYVLIPLSVLFCKYYEHLGRNYDSWGKLSYTGVTLDKNMFGYLLFAFGLFFVAAFMSRRAEYRGERNRVHSDQVINILFLAMIGWLFTIVDSKTAMLALMFGIAVIVALRSARVRRYFWYYALSAILIALVAEGLFSVKSAIIEASGRDATFTGRTGLWETLLQEPINPVVGTGYTSFWLGERLTRFWEMYPNSPPIQAHNGYLEVYLNLGLIGVFLIAAVLWMGLRRMQSRMAASFSSSNSETLNDRILANFGIAYGAAYLLYNVTEATFQGLNFLFTIFLILAFKHQKKN